MAIKQHFRVKFIDYVRMTIGDSDKVIFTDDELKSLIEKHMCTQLTTHTVTAYNSRYRVSPCCAIYPGCCCGVGIYLLEVTVGVDDAVYVLDEAAGWIIFDPLDPENTAVAPVDGTTISVQYYGVSPCALFIDIFFTLSSNHAKLKLAHNIMGVQMDLKELSKSFYDTAVRWAAKG